MRPILRFYKKAQWAFIAVLGMAKKGSHNINRFVEFGYFLDSKSYYQKCLIMCKWDTLQKILIYPNHAAFYPLRKIIISDTILFL